MNQDQYRNLTEYFKPRIHDTAKHYSDRYQVEYSTAYDLLLIAIRRIQKEEVNGLLHFNLWKAAVPAEDQIWIAATKEVESKLGVAKDKAPSNNGFSHAPDYSSVTIRGRRFVLTPKQAAVIRYLDQCRTDGNPEVRQDTILEEVLDSSTDRLRNLFREKDKRWEALLSPGAKRGTIRLNLPS